MKKKTKKRIIVLVSLVLVLGACIGAYVILDNINKENEKAALEDNTADIVAFDSEGAIVTAITFPAGEESLSFTYKNDMWYYDADENYPVDQEKLLTISDAVTHITAAVRVSEPDSDLSLYGLDVPALKISAAYSDGSEKTFMFGDVSNFNNCQYFMAEGDGEIYMVETTLATNFGVDLDSLYGAESYQLLSDVVYAKNVISFTICTSDGRENTISDGDGVYELYDLVYYGFDLSEWEDYHADSEELQNTYGIGGASDRVVVKYFVENEDKTRHEKEYTTYIGYKFTDAEGEDGEEGHSYFYSPEGSSVVYKASGEDVDEIFEYLNYKAPEETTGVEE